MRNSSLALDHITRARKRLSAVNALFKEEAWADVVRESQEIVELSLKALLRAHKVDAPQIHDVSEILLQNQSLLAKAIQKDLEKICDISRGLRRDRELSFYGSEDLTPSEFYKRKDAVAAREQANWIVSIVQSQVPE